MNILILFSQLEHSIFHSEIWQLWLSADCWQVYKLWIHADKSKPGPFVCLYVDCRNAVRESIPHCCWWQVSFHLNNYTDARHTQYANSLCILIIPVIRRLKPKKGKQVLMIVILILRLKKLTKNCYKWK